MRIGEVAKLTGVSVRAIRHYDALGLLRAIRGENKYRSFTAEDAERVPLIQSFLSVGFRLEEIRDHAPCWQAGSPASLRGISREQSREFLQRKLLELNERMNVMSAIRSRLQDQLEAHWVDEEQTQGIAVPISTKKAPRRE